MARASWASWSSAGARACTRSAKPGWSANGPLGQGLELLQARAGVGLGEHGVKAQQGDRLLLEEGVGQARHVVAGPGPPPHLGQAFFIDVDDHHPLVQRGGHGGAQARVVDDVVEAVQHAHGRHTHGVQHRKNQGQQGDRHPGAVAAQGLHQR